ncbi:hypothetical protein QEN19_001534 [Hanseniaspora menglaensis]
MVQKNNIKKSPHTFNDDKFPLLNKNNIDSCRYSNWYPKFEKNYAQYLVKSYIMNDIPESFVTFLLQDNIKLKYDGNLEFNDNDEFSDWSSDEESNDNSSDAADPISSYVDPAIDFFEVNNFISNSFKKSEKLTPRFNWSAPKDSVWILPYNNTMLTYTNEDVYLLLKGSNYIMHDLIYPYENVKGAENGDVNNHSLILREWIDDINPSMEFRCFIKNGLIVGISQRDIRTEYCYLNDIVGDLKIKIENFVESVFKPTFFDSEELEENGSEGQNAVIDMYLNLDTNYIKLIDVNPFCRSTEPLLFSWNELITKNTKEDYEFRLGENNTKLGARDHSENQIPLEIFDASLDPEKLRELTYEWSRLLSKQIKEEDC